MIFKVSSAEKANFLLHSTCNDVKSNRRGGASVPSFLETSLMENGAFLTCSNNAKPSSFLSNLPLVTEKMVSRYVVFNSQYGVGMKFCISSCLLTIRAKVGV